MEPVSLVREIQTMYYNEHLGVGEIAGALGQDPRYVYEAIFKAPIEIEFN